MRDGDVFRLTVTGGQAGDGADNDQYTIQLAHFGPTFGKFFLGTVMDVVTASPLDACSTVSNAAAMAGKIALLERGNCEFIDKVIWMLGPDRQQILRSANAIFPRFDAKSCVIQRIAHGRRHVHLQ